MTHPHPAKAKYIAQYWTQQRPLILSLYRDTVKQINMFGSVTTRDSVASSHLIKEARLSFRRMRQENSPRNLSKFKKKKTAFLRDLKQANTPDYSKVIKILTVAYREKQLRPAHLDPKAIEKAR